MEKKRIKQAVGYVRVSTAGQVEGTSLDEQRRRIRSHCEGQNFKFLCHYSDEGASGSVMERPQFQNMLKDATDEKFDVVEAARMMVIKSGKLVGVKLRPHDLRRHSVTYASRSGVPIEIVSKIILRHANLSTTQ